MTKLCIKCDLPKGHIQTYYGHLFDPRNAKCDVCKKSFADAINDQRRVAARTIIPKMKRASDDL